MTPSFDERMAILREQAAAHPGGPDGWWQSMRAKLWRIVEAASTDDELREIIGQPTTPFAADSRQ